MFDEHKLLTPDVVQPSLQGRFGRPYLWCEECTSTQDVLRDGALPEGALAVTEHQTAGRGRSGRAWDDAAGSSLLCSLLLRPPTGSPVEQLSLVVGLAVAEAADATAAVVSQLKWPNDVLVDGRKVAGVLLESGGGAVICGIGINVDQSEHELPAPTRLPPASLRTATGRRHDRAVLLAELLARLEQRYDTWLDSGLAALLPELERRDALHGSVVGIGDVTGTAAGIAEDGRLRLQLPDGTTTLVASGEVVSALGRRTE